ncbi:MAG: Vms1/Ankzf1 family peptidyl-tRNA hydrolase [Dehalococcoidia bacterium]
MPTERDLRRLARFRSARDGVLTLYVAFDPASGERRDAQAAIHDALASIPVPTGERLRARLEEERERVATWAREEFELHGRSLVVFSCGPRDLLETYQLQAPVRTLGRFGERAAVAPFAALLDEYERYAVVLLDKETAHILTVFLNRIESRVDAYDDTPGRSAMGGWAQARYARHREAHLHRHALHVMEALRQQARKRPFDRLIVGGPDEPLAAFLAVLPRPLRSRLAGTFSGELFASDNEVLSRVSAIETAAERRAEAELVAQVIDAAKGGGPAVLGWDQTVQALGEGRAHKLLLADGAAQSGFACPERHFAAVEALDHCPVCQGAVERVGDLAEWAVEAAMDTDALIEDVRGPAAEALLAEGGAGAVLRY